MNRLRWDKRLKRRLGYYNVRRRLWRRVFERFRRATDVFLVGHPKSGNTWVAYMLAVLLSRDRDRHVNLGNVRHFVPPVHGRDHKVIRYRQMPDPRVFRQEFPCYPDLYRRVIYLVRDPRAALVSFWHMFLVMGDTPGTSLDSFLEQYMAHDGCFDWWNRDLERWDRQVEAWFDRAESDPGVLIVRYEDLVGDRAASVERIARFLDAGATAEDIAMAIERGDFSAMRRVEELHGTEAYRTRDPRGERFIRRGLTDGWRDELAPELARMVERELGPVMHRLGYLP